MWLPSISNFNTNKYCTLTFTDVILPLQVDMFDTTGIILWHFFILNHVTLKEDT